jgi:hypothetical protein
MQFRTILKPKSAEYRIHAIRGVRGLWFDHFNYELSDDPTAEGIRTQIVTTGGCLPRDLWPEVEVGVRLGYEDALSRGVRFCSVRFTMTFAKYHDVDTTPRAVHVNVSHCVSGYLVQQSEPVPSFRAEWLTSDVLAVAKGIHANQALDGIPALCDALLEAGCDDPLVIEHLQGCPDHSPSCWVVEIIMNATRARGDSG